MAGENLQALHINDFEAMFRRSHHWLCTVAMRYVHDQQTAEDMVQDFFLDFWQRRQSIQLSTSFEAYARRAVKYKCIDFIRKSAVTEQRNAMLNALEAEHDDVDEAEQEAAKHQRYQSIVALVKKLPESRQQIFLMHALGKMSYAAIAEKQNISINTVKTQLSRAYASLRNHVILLAIALIHCPALFKFILEKK